MYFSTHRIFLIRKKGMGVWYTSLSNIQILVQGTPVLCNLMLPDLKILDKLSESNKVKYLNGSKP